MTHLAAPSRYKRRIFRGTPPNPRKGRSPYTPFPYSPTSHCTLISCLLKSGDDCFSIIPTDVPPNYAQQRLMSNWLQVQDDLLVVGGSIRTATGIQIALVGPTGEIPGRVLVVVSASP